MFNLSGSELIFLLLIALVVLGPEKLPEAIRSFTKFYGEVRKMGAGFQSELRNALDEPMREMRDTADALRKAVDTDALTTALRSTDPTPEERGAEPPVAASPVDEPPVDEPAAAAPPVGEPAEVHETESTVGE